MSGLGDYLNQGIGALTGTSLSQQSMMDLMKQQGSYANQTASVPYVPPKYKSYTVRIDEISNGFVLVYGNDKFFCADMKEVGERVIACMVTTEITK